MYFKYNNNIFLDYLLSKWEKNDYTVGTIPKLNMKILERGNIYTLQYLYPTISIHHPSQKIIFEFKNDFL